MNALRPLSARLPHAGLRARRIRTRGRSSLGPLLPAVLLVAACGGDGGAPGSDDAAAGSATSDGALSAVELEQGIGPVRDMALAPIDPVLAQEGETFFNMKCSACHKIEERYVGPRLGTVLARRRPEFVMNMMLNANEMVKRHPAVLELLAQFYTPMPVQVTDPDEARAILEYLRSAQIDSLATASADPAGGDR